MGWDGGCPSNLSRLCSVGPPREPCVPEGGGFLPRVRGRLADLESSPHFQIESRLSAGEGWCPLCRVLEWWPSVAASGPAQSQLVTPACRNSSILKPSSNT